MSAESADELLRSKGIDSLVTNVPVDLYQLDYSTEMPQPDSRLCNIPDEIVLEIGRLLFAGFALEFQ
jgi:hypothetical protein